MTKVEEPRQTLTTVTQHSLAARLANLVPIQPLAVSADARSPAEYPGTELEQPDQA